MPKPKFNDLRKLLEYIKKSEISKEGKRLVDASKNTAKGSRPRISGTVKTGGEPSKVVIVGQNPLLNEGTMQLPEFKPYYISDGNPNVLTQTQQEIKDALVKTRQIDLAKYQRDLANRGLNTPASFRRAGAIAIATNPDAIITQPEGLYKPTYNSGIQEWEGAPLREWFDLASAENVPYGPNSLWRKWYQPLHDATHSFDVLGQNYRGEAPSISIQQLGFGLNQIAPYLGIKPVKIPYIPPVTTVKSKYVAPTTSITENPDYLAYQTAIKDMQNAGMNIDIQRLHPEWYIPNSRLTPPEGFVPTFNHFSTQGFTTRGHMFAEDLDSGLGDLHIIMGEPVDPRKPKVSREWYPIDSGSREDEIVRFIGINPNKTGIWKQGGVVLAKSGIHIKKANRGKFTDYCGGKVTSECIARGKASSNPTIRKRATFAANARKWKHQNGGKIIPYWVYNILGGE